MISRVWQNSSGAAGCVITCDIKKKQTIALWKQESKQDVAVQHFPSWLIALTPSFHLHFSSHSSSAPLLFWNKTRVYHVLLRWEVIKSPRPAPDLHTTDSRWCLAPRRRQWNHKQGFSGPQQKSFDMSFDSWHFLVNNGRRSPQHHCYRHSETLQVF